MSIFGKAPKKTVKIRDRIIDAMNFTPPDYQHTDSYYRRMQNPLSDARADIKNIPISALADDNEVICDLRDPGIDSFINSEIISGRKQYIYNVGSILQIFDSINESKPTAEAKRKHLTSDLEKIEKDIAKYEEMQNKADS